MDPLGILPSVTAQTASLPALPVKAAAPSLPLPGAGATGGGDSGQDVDIRNAEQKRYEAVKQAAQEIANVYIVSDKTFTIFKDATGQYITRFTSLRDGRVTYIPEPELFKRASSAVAPLVTLNV